MLPDDVERGPQQPLLLGLGLLRVEQGPQGMRPVRAGHLRSRPGRARCHMTSMNKFGWSVNQTSLPSLLVYYVVYEADEHLPRRRPG